MSLENKRATEDYEWLVTKSQVIEKPFVSETAVIGGLIAHFREWWNSISTKWYVRPLLQQQNEFNRLVVHTIQEHDEWLIAQDHEQTDHNRKIAELTVQLFQTNRLLYSIDERLSHIEARQ